MLIFNYSFKYQSNLPGLIPCMLIVAPSLIKTLILIQEKTIKPLNSRPIMIWF